MPTRKKIKFASGKVLPLKVHWPVLGECRVLEPISEASVMLPEQLNIMLGPTLDRSCVIPTVHLGARPSLALDAQQLPVMMWSQLTRYIASITFKRLSGPSSF